MFGLSLKDVKGGMIFIMVIIMFCLLASWNNSRLNKNNIDNNSNMVYNVGGSLYE